jgi:hypothetical protein
MKLKKLGMTISRAWGMITDTVRKAYRKFNVKDPLFIGGFVSFWYGLYLYSHSVAYSVCGFILMTLSYLMKEKDGRA